MLDRLRSAAAPIDDLMAFVNAEKGRAADDSLKDTLPVILYFGSEADREGFMALAHEALPGMTAKRMP
jgi:hypothetical protein